MNKEQLHKYISVACFFTLSQKLLKILMQVGDIFILNIGKHQVFDQIINYYLYLPDTQLLLYLDGVAGSGKSILMR